MIRKIWISPTILIAVNWDETENLTYPQNVIHYKNHSPKLPKSCWSAIKENNIVHYVLLLAYCKLIACTLLYDVVFETFHTTRH